MSPINKKNKQTSKTLLAYRMYIKVSQIILFITAHEHDTLRHKWHDAHTKYRFMLREIK